MPSKYLPLTVVAERLGVHRVTVRRFIAQGDIQAVTIGKQLRIAEDELERYLASSVVHPDTAA